MSEYHFTEAKRLTAPGEKRIQVYASVVETATRLGYTLWQVDLYREAKEAIRWMNDNVVAPGLVMIMTSEGAAVVEVVEMSRKG